MAWWPILARISGWWHDFSADRKGATTAEYALLLALVVIILISTLSQLGRVLNTKLLDIIQQLEVAQ